MVIVLTQDDADDADADDGGADSEGMRQGERDYKWGIFYALPHFTSSKVLHSYHLSYLRLVILSVG